MTGSPPLPFPLTPLIGREVELTELDDQLRRPSVRLVTLTGPGGVGKTRLALHVAGRLRDAFPDGVWLVRLEAIREVELVLATIAQAVGIADASASDLAEHIASWLGPGRHLFLIDNFEQVAEASPVLADLLQRCPGLKLLVTSRTSLGVYGEHDYPLGPLPLPASVDGSGVAGLLAYPAVKLFVDRATEVKPSFALTPENAADVLAICQRLDGLALAIELAAARIKVLTPAALRERLANRLRVLTSGARSLPARQQTMRGAIAWSYELLSADDRRVFRLLGVFSGGFGLDALETVVERRNGAGGAELIDLDLLLEQMTDLVDHSLVRRVDHGADEPRFALFQTIQEYATDLLEEAGEGVESRRAHGEWVAALVLRAEPQLTGPDQMIWFERLETEHDNIRAALTFAIHQQEADLGQRIGGHLWRFWWLHGHLTEGSRWLEQVLALPGEVPPSTRGYAVHALAAMAEELGNFEVAIPGYERALDIAREIGDEHLQAHANTALGNVGLARGNYDESVSRSRDALALFERLGDRRGIAGCHHNIATVAYHRGDLEAAEAGYRHAMEELAAIGDERSRVMILANIGVIAFERRDFETAQQIQEEAAATMRSMGDEIGYCNSLANLAGVLIELGDSARAMELNRQALEIAERIGLKRNLGYIRSGIGQQLRDRGENAEAAQYLLASLVDLQECGDQAAVANVLGTLAEMAHTLGDSILGARLFGASRGIRDAIGTSHAPDQVEDYERVLGLVRTGAGDEAFEAAWAAGMTAPIEETVRDAACITELASAAPRDPRDVELEQKTGLTAREITVIRQMVAGKSNQEIAATLSLNLGFVATIIGQIYTKLGVDSLADVTAYAFKNGLV
ncbi:MAG TPA: tetratricopeptide repeat protein [Thermomicrobiales bacterium]|jgi:predicted ATPase/tetratricopeptide (TPR) repeat protein/DNA-binding CsgD family transcriptional regulator|nr:tetratricopeptide repeat protein [Thermomicrobiales bacterium]